MIKIIFAVIGLLILWQIARLLSLKGDLSSYRTYWIQQNEVVPKDEYITYVALGDSAAQGIGASKPTKGYVGLVAEEISTRQGKPVRIINLSKSGARAVDIVNDQLPVLKNLKPDIVTLAIGANDVLRYDEPAFRQSIDTIVAALPSGSIMANTPNFSGGRKDHGEIRSMELSAYIDQAVKSREDIKLADLHTSTIAMNSFGTYSADFFHPSDKGYKLWARSFIDQL